MLEKNQEYYQKLKIIHESIEEVIFDKNLEGKVVVWIDPAKCDKGYLVRVETIIINK